MKIIRYSIKKHLFIFSICSLLELNAQENTEDIVLKHLDTLVVDIKQTLASNTLAAAERDQIYDIVGSIGICRPVVQTVLEQSVSQVLVPPAATPNPEHHLTESQALPKEPDHTPDVPHHEASFQHISSMDAILSKFDDLKQRLVQQLADNKIEPAHRESAYTLIGSINLCRPILKGADLLSEKMKTEATKDHSISTPASEGSTSIPNHSMPSSNISGPIAS